MRDLINDMKACEQTKGVSVLEHGKSVHAYFMDLYNHINEGTPLKFQWRLPEWAADKHLWNKLFDIDTVKMYQIFHDCGKPYCVTVDEQGRRHFPDHAAVSARTWEAYDSPP